MVRSAREGASLTQEVLARRVGIAPKTLSLIEGGKLGPTVTTLSRLANAVGLSLGDLFREVRPPVVQDAVEWRGSEVGRLFRLLPTAEQEALLALLRARLAES
ncbi:MAG: helix-turn-helix transcriptional regulator [Deltaproteobacteria bacterium]|nr:helix-turn-helix transcriptional regulator [Deltaproteobacteria bacterium]